MTICGKLWKKNGFVKRFGENCVDSFVNEMLEMESYLKYYTKKKLKTLIEKITTLKQTKLDAGYVKKCSERMNNTKKG